MKVAIVGAGTAGLAAAYDLTRLGHDVTLYEAAGQVGGLAGGFTASGWDWSLENFYHHWFESDDAVLDLIREIGHGDKIVFPRPLTAVYHGGKFYPLDASLAALFPKRAWLDKIPGAGFMARGILALTFPGFSWPDKIRFGLVGVYLVLTPRWQPLERVTAHEWLRRWSGQRVYQALWEPLLIGKFGERHYRDVNMAWFWARVHKRTPRLGTFVGGFQAFFDLLAEKARRQGASIRLNTPVTEIVDSGMQAAGAPSQPALSVRTPEDEATFDAVIATTSPRLLTKLATGLPASYTQQLLKLKSMGAVVLILELAHQLSEQGFYWHNLPKGEAFPFLNLCEHTNYVGPENFGGSHLVYLGDYLETDHEYFRLSKEELLARFLPSLQRFNPKFEPSWVKDSWLFKEAYAQPVPPVGHSANIPPIRTPISGLYFASMSQVYPWDRGTNYAVEMGRQVAEMVHADASSLNPEGPVRES